MTVQTFKEFSFLNSHSHYHSPPKLPITYSVPLLLLFLTPPTTCKGLSAAHILSDISAACNTAASPPSEAFPLAPWATRLICSSEFIHAEWTHSCASGFSCGTQEKHWAGLGIKRPSFYFWSENCSVSGDTHFNFSELCLFIYKVSGFDLRVFQTFFTVTHTLHCDSAHTCTNTCMYVYIHTLMHKYYMPTCTTWDMLETFYSLPLTLTCMPVPYVSL